MIEQFQWYFSDWIEFFNVLPSSSSFVCQVVYIAEKKHSRAATGFLKLLPDKPFAMFSPVDHRVPRINVPLADCPEDFSSRPGDYTNTLFICRITNWAADSNFAEGCVSIHITVNSITLLCQPSCLFF